MKFKSIFFLFNLVVIFSFLLIFLLPFLLLGENYSSVFWLDNWYLASLFLVLIIILDSYFVYNWKLFVFLEKEDWNNLTQYLEKKIYEKGHLSRQYIKMMINTSLAVSNLDKIDRLTKEIEDRRPKILPQYALLLGIPYFLRNESTEAVTFYGNYIDDSKTGNRFWVLWVYAFSLIRDGNNSKAETVLIRLLDEKTDDILKLLILYSLDSIGFTSDKLNKKFLEHKNRFSVEKKWTNYVDSNRGKNIFIILLTSILDEARKWVKVKEY